MWTLVNPKYIRYQWLGFPDVVLFGNTTGRVDVRSEEAGSDCILSIWAAFFQSVSAPMALMVPHQSVSDIGTWREQWTFPNVYQMICRWSSCVRFYPTCWKWWFPRSCYDLPSVLFVFTIRRVFQVHISSRAFDIYFIRISWSRRSRTSFISSINCALGNSNNARQVHHHVAVSAYHLNIIPSFQGSGIQFIKVQWTDAQIP